jgi:hypothetical protein
MGDILGDFEIAGVRRVHPDRLVAAIIGSLNR